MTIIKKLELEKKKQSQIIPSKGIIFLASFFISSLIVAEIWVSHTIVSLGEDFKDIENLQKSISSENLLLQNEIAKHSSLINVASKSASLGFSPTKKVQYIR